MASRYTVEDRRYVKYCIRYAVRVLGKKNVLKYIHSLTEFGDEQ